MARGRPGGVTPSRSIGHVYLCSPLRPIEWRVWNFASSPPSALEVAIALGATTRDLKGLFWAGKSVAKMPKSGRSIQYRFCSAVSPVIGSPEGALAIQPRVSERWSRDRSPGYARRNTRPVCATIQRSYIFLAEGHEQQWGNAPGRFLHFRSTIASARSHTSI